MLCLCYVYVTFMLCLCYVYVMFMLCYVYVMFMLCLCYVYVILCLCYVYVMFMLCLCYVYVMFMLCLCLCYVYVMYMLCYVYVMFMLCLCYVYVMFIWNVLTYIILFICCVAATQRGSWPLHSWGFLDHTQRRIHSRQDSSGQVISSSQRPLPDNTRHSQQTNIHAPGGIRTHYLSRRAAAELLLRPRGYWYRRHIHNIYKFITPNTDISEQFADSQRIYKN